MKKLFATAILTTLAATQAQADLNQWEVPPQQGFVAQYHFDVYKEVNQVLQPTNNRTISRSDPSHRLCWSVVSSTPSFGRTVNAKETFVSPKGANFSDGNAIVQSSIDGSRHTVSSVLNSISQSAVERCWRFDTKDAVGEYTIHIELDGSAVATETFTVAP